MGLEENAQGGHVGRGVMSGRSGSLNSQYSARRRGRTAEEWGLSRKNWGW